MIMAGIEFCDEIPFKNVYLTGIVRDKQGRKMSKSLGNSPDPIELIKKFGADGVRLGMLLTSPAGNDLPFDESLCEQGRNFNNKLWNAFRLIQSWEVADVEEEMASIQAIDWFNSRFEDERIRIEDLLNKYRISEALMAIYKLVWDDYCAWFLECIKPEYQKPINERTKTAATNYLKDLLRLLHPFTPFITEEIWSFVKNDKDSIFLLTDKEAEEKQLNQTTLTQFELVREIVTSIRNFRNEKGISPKTTLKLYCKSRDEENKLPFEEVLLKLANIDEILYTKNKPESSFLLSIRTDEFFIPASENIDVEAEKEKLKTELEYLKGFLISVNRKLSNEKFVSNAKPEIVANEKKKEADALQKIDVLESQIKELST